MTEVNKTENGYTLYGDDGEVIGTIDSEGWNLVDGNYYYLANGSLVKGTDYRHQMVHGMYLIIREEW